MTPGSTLHHIDENLPIYMVDFVAADGRPCVVGCLEEELVSASGIPPPMDAPRLTLSDELATTVPAIDRFQTTVVGAIEPNTL